METPKSIVSVRSRAGERSQRRLATEFDRLQPSEDSGLVLDSPRTRSTPLCGQNQRSVVLASLTTYRRREKRSCADWCHVLLWICGISAAVVLGGLVAFAWKKLPEIPAVLLSKLNVLPGLIAAVGFISFAGILYLVLQCVKSDRLENILIEDTHEDINCNVSDTGPENRLSYSENIQQASPGNISSGFDFGERVPVITEQPVMKGTTTDQSNEAENNDCQGREDNVSVSLTNMLASQKLKIHEYLVRRTFSGITTDVWSEFIQYFENLAELNNWDPEKSRRVLLSTFRGQAETYAYGLPLVFQKNYDRLKKKMDERFGHVAMKERYIAEAKLRHKQPNESFRDFGQALEDSYRRAYPGNPEIVEESAIKSFLDKCGQDEDFRLAVKRCKPKTLQEAVTSAMQEDCLRVGERELSNERKVFRRPILGLDDANSNSGNGDTKAYTRHDYKAKPNRWNTRDQRSHSTPWQRPRAQRQQNPGMTRSKFAVDAKTENLN